MGCLYLRMLVFRYFFFVGRLAEAHVFQVGGGETTGVAPQSAGETPDAEPQRAPGLLLALGLATLVHVLLFWALTAHPGAKRGAKASFQVELWPAFEAQLIAEPAPAVLQTHPAPLRLEATDAGVTIEQKPPTQKKTEEPERRVLEQPQRDEQQRQEQREQKQGCLGPEEMARLEQLRRSDTDPQTDGRAVEMGVPCVAG